MQVKFDIDIEADKGALVAALGCEAPELDAELTKHAKAALHEYIECYVGRRAFTRGSDMLEHRLALLVEHAFGRRIPSASAISNLLQTTLTASRSLIRATFSKYRFQLGAVEEASVKVLLENAVWQDKDSCFVKTAAPNLVELMNRRLLAEDPTLREVARMAGVLGSYTIDKLSYEVLCKLLKATAVAPPQA